MLQESQDGGCEQVVTVSSNLQPASNQCDIGPV